MPFKSKAQQRFMFANRKELERDGVDVKEWAESTNYKHLPEKVSSFMALEYFEKLAALPSHFGVSPTGHSTAQLRAFLSGYTPNKAVMLSRLGIGGAAMAIPHAEWVVAPALLGASGYNAARNTIEMNKQIARGKRVFGTPVAAAQAPAPAMPAAEAPIAPVSAPEKAAAMLSFPLGCNVKIASALGTIAGGLGGAALGGFAGHSMSHMPDQMDAAHVEGNAHYLDQHGIGAGIPDRSSTTTAYFGDNDESVGINNEPMSSVPVTDINHTHALLAEQADSQRNLATEGGAAIGGLAGAQLGSAMTRPKHAALEYFKLCGLGQAAMHGLRAGGNALAMTAAHTGAGLAAPILAAGEGMSRGSIPARIGNGLLGAGVGTAAALPLAALGLGRGVAGGARHISDAVHAGMNGLPMPGMRMG